MTCYVHHVPGRLRVRVPAAKDNATNAVRLVTRLNTLEGITSVAANEVTGSILIRYDTTAFDPAACLAILNIQPMRQPETRRGARSISTFYSTRRLVSRFAEVATWYVLEQALERSAQPAFLRALI